MWSQQKLWRGDLPSESNTTAVAHAVAQDLARHDLVGVKDGDQLLSMISVEQNGVILWQLTASVTDLGKLEM